MKRAFFIENDEKTVTKVENIHQPSVYRWQLFDIIADIHYAHACLAYRVGILGEHNAADGCGELFLCLAEDVADFGHYFAFFYFVHYGVVGDEDATFLGAEPFGVAAEDCGIDGAEEAALYHAEIDEDVADADDGVLNHFALEDHGVFEFEGEAFDAYGAAVSAEGFAACFAVDYDFRVLELCETCGGGVGHVGAYVPAVFFAAACGVQVDKVVKFGDDSFDEPVDKDSAGCSVFGAGGLAVEVELVVKAALACEHSGHVGGEYADDGAFELGHAQLAEELLYYVDTVELVAVQGRVEPDNGAFFYAFGDEDGDSDGLSESVVDDVQPISCYLPGG